MSEIFYPLVDDKRGDESDRELITLLISKFLYFDDLCRSSIFLLTYSLYTSSALECTRVHLDLGLDAGDSIILWR